MQSFYAEFSKVIGYTFYIKFLPGCETKILLTPTPSILYFSICGKTYSIPLLSPILSLSDVVYSQEEDYLYIKIPSISPSPFELLSKKEISFDIKSISCKNCSKVLAEGFEKSYPMPSTNWETLSELWNCHPSHEQTYSLEIRSKSCYISLFYIHFKSESIQNHLINNQNILFCPNCNQEVGFFTEEFILHRHLIFIHENEDLKELIIQALYERINESDREIQLGNIRIKLMKWENFVYTKGAFKKCINVLFKKDEATGFSIPKNDLDSIWNMLKKFGKKLPKNVRKFGDWKNSVLVCE